MQKIKAMGWGKNNLLETAELEQFTRAVTATLITEMYERGEQFTSECSPLYYVEPDST